MENTNKLLFSLLIICAINATKEGQKTNASSIPSTPKQNLDISHISENMLLGNYDDSYHVKSLPSNISLSNVSRTISKNTDQEWKNLMLDVVGDLNFNDASEENFNLICSEPFESYFDETSIQFEDYPNRMEYFQQRYNVELITARIENLRNVKYREEEPISTLSFYNDDTRQHYTMRYFPKSRINAFFKELKFMNKLGSDETGLLGAMDMNGCFSDEFGYFIIMEIGFKYLPLSSYEIYPKLLNFNAEERKDFIYKLVSLYKILSDKKIFHGKFQPDYILTDPNMVNIRIINFINSYIDDTSEVDEMPGSHNKPKKKINMTKWLRFFDTNTLKGVFQNEIANLGQLLFVCDINGRKNYIKQKKGMTSQVLSDEEYDDNFLKSVYTFTKNDFSEHFKKLITMSCTIKKSNTKIDDSIDDNKNENVLFGCFDCGGSSKIQQAPNLKIVRQKIIQCPKFQELLLDILSNQTKNQLYINTYNILFRIMQIDLQNYMDFTIEPYDFNPRRFDQNQFENLVRIRDKHQNFYNKMDESQMLTLQLMDELNRDRNLIAPIDSFRASQVSMENTNLNMLKDSYHPEMEFDFKELLI